MKYLLGILCILFSIQLNAQEKKVVKKKVESKKVIKKKVTSEDDVFLEVNVEVIDGKEVKTYVLKETKDGETKVTKWNGDGEMPANIKMHMDKVESEGVDDVEEEKMIIIEIDDDGEKKVMKWKGDGEMSEEMKRALEENDIEIHEEGGIVKKKKVYKSRGEAKFYDVKVKMGVGLNPTADGVKISFVQEGSCAERAGLMEGDILIQIGDQRIFNDESVYKALSKYQPDDQVNVDIIRDRNEKQLKITLDSK